VGLKTQAKKKCENRCTTFGEGAGALGIGKKGVDPKQKKPKNTRGGGKGHLGIPKMKIRSLHGLKRMRLETAHFGATGRNRTKEAEVSSV